MNITKSQLKQIIKEEIQQIISEKKADRAMYKAFVDVIKKMPGVAIGYADQMYQREFDVEQGLATAVTHPEVTFPGDVKGEITLYFVHTPHTKKTE